MIYVEMTQMSDLLRRIAVVNMMFNTSTLSSVACYGLILLG